MFGFVKKKKRNFASYPLFDEFDKKVQSLLDSDSFISKKQYLPLQESIARDVTKFKNLQDDGLFDTWCERQNYDTEALNNIIIRNTTLGALINDHNERYVNRHMADEHDYLVNLLSPYDPNIKLDDEQQKVVLRDEDYTLVIAGAGTGKTASIAAKVRYLVERKGVDPKRILVVSLTRKATRELKERINDGLGIPARISTFHSIGYAIRNENEPVKVKPVGDGFLFNTLRDYLQNQLKSEDFIKKVLLFFASYLTPPFDTKNISALHTMLADNNFTTMENDLKTAMAAYQQELTKTKITLKEEKVKSYEEVAIANYLFINGIEYKYEPIYEYGFATSIRAYTPDFLITQGDKKVYLEHFGIREDLTSDRFSPAELDIYKQHIQDKIALHKRHDTKLIYTFSSYNDGKGMIEHLEEKLRDLGFAYSTKDDTEIYKQLAKVAEDKYFNRLTVLLMNFISRFEIGDYPEPKLYEWLASARDERTRLFLQIVIPCFANYQAEMKSRNYIDFEGMINDAVRVLDDIIKAGNKAPFDYVFVDEYQDISLQRFDLCKKLSEASNAKIIAVGDDWQSIYRFAGSNLGLFTHFKEKMGYADEIKITNTYRNSQELINMAGSFVMDNPEQIKKALHSTKSLRDPVYFYTFDDSYDKDEAGHGMFDRMLLALQSAIDKIVADSGQDKKILLIGRFHYDGANIGRNLDLFEYNETTGQVICKKYPKLQIDFMTAHGAKGLGYENAIIINARDAVMGFPCKIDDDPLMKLIIGNGDDFEFGEERRLFYVAMTRTKNRLYIIAPRFRPSSFLLQLRDKFRTIPIVGDRIEPKNVENKKPKCPICGYPLQRRANQSLGFTLYVCSNDPEICGYMTNNLASGKMQICKCPSCQTGFLVAKKAKSKTTGEEFVVMGCTNFKKDKTGCDYRLLPRNYSDNKEVLARLGKLDLNDANNLIYKGYPLMDLLGRVESALSEIASKKPGFNINSNTLAGFLLGSQENMYSTTRLCELSTYKSLGNFTQEELTSFIIKMTIAGMLDSIGDTYHSVKAKPDAVTPENTVTFYSSLVR
jgi:ATP-dependent exoDNAse (exonuclease V) beta subunit (contains helicase and exonuclease domains)